ncbi:MAG TPA: murein biosynthesis integral membrane protein MurJ [Trueperaceae bacterium]
MDASAEANGRVAAAERSSRRGALTLMGGTLASRVTGLVRNSLLAQFFPTAAVDAFVTAFKVPNLFRELLAEGALINSFVPVYKRLEPADARRLSGALLSLLALLNGALLLAAYLAAPLLARLLIADGGHVDVELTTRLIRVVFPFLPAISLSALAMGLLNAEERFAAPAWAPVALNLVTAALMAAFPGQAVTLALAHVLGAAAQLAVQVPALARAGLLPRPRLPWHPALTGVAVLMVPFAVTTSGRQVVNVVASNVVTGIDAGAQGAFYLADLFLSLCLGLFGTSPALAYYSRLSAHAARGDDASFASSLAEGARLIAFLAAPAGAALAVLAPQVVDVVYGWRSLLGQPLDAVLRAYTVQATSPLALAVFPLAAHALLVRTFYVRGRVGPPVAIALASLTLQGTLYYVLAGPFGVGGVAAAVAVAGWVQLLLTAGLVSRAEGFSLAAFAGHAARALAAAALAAAASYGAVLALPAPPTWAGSLLELVAGGLAFVAVYAGAAALLGLPELAAVRRLLRR